MKLVRSFTIAASALALAASALFACVGDDPDPSPATNPGVDAGDGSSGGPADGTSNVDSAPPIDAGLDGPRCDKTRPFADPIVMGAPINAADKSELGISMTEDELIAIVEQDGELLYTKRASRALPFEPLTGDFMLQINTGVPESSPSLSPDGKTIYFVRNGNLMVARREDVVDSFPAPQTVYADDAGQTNVESTRINHTGSRLHWTSNDDDPTLIADRSGTGYATFVSARSLAGPLTSIAFSGDELTLYFLAQEDGGVVMKYATRQTTSTALGPQLDMPANLRSFHPLHVTYDDCIMYVRARQASDDTKFDIFEARRPN